MILMRLRSAVYLIRIIVRIFISMYSWKVCIVVETNYAGIMCQKMYL